MGLLYLDVVILGLSLIPDLFTCFSGLRALLAGIGVGLNWRIQRSGCREDDCVLVSLLAEMQNKAKAADLLTSSLALLHCFAYEMPRNPKTVADFPYVPINIGSRSELSSRSLPIQAKSVDICQRTSSLTHLMTGIPTVHPSTWFSISKSHRNHRYAGRTRNYEWPMRTSGDFKLLRANSLVDLDFSVFGVWFSVFGTFLARGKPFIQINPATSICITLWSRFCFSATLLIKFSYLYVKIYIYEF